MWTIVWMVVYLYTCISYGRDYIIEELYWNDIPVGVKDQTNDTYYLATIYGRENR